MIGFHMAIGTVRYRSPVAKIHAQVERRRLPVILFRLARAAVSRCKDERLIIQVRGNRE